MSSTDIGFTLCTDSHHPPRRIGLRWLAVLIGTSVRALPSGKGDTSVIVPQNGGSATYPRGTSCEAAVSRCREAFGRMVRLAGVVERLAIGRLLILVRAFDAMDLQRATAPRLSLHVLPAGRILSRLRGRLNSRTRRIPNLGAQTAEKGNDHRTLAEEVGGRVVLSWFRRNCRGCDLLFWRWEKHDCAACLKRREWREDWGRTLAARWEAARRPPTRDTTDGFVWMVACRCGCRSVELTEDGAMCPRCGIPAPSGIAWPPRSGSAN
jgi:hypothetical protein